MSATMTVDTKRFRDGARRLAEVTKKTEGEILRQVAKNFVSYCVRFTPPFGKSPVSESFNEQRRLGEAAVKRDIGRTMIPIDAVKAYHAPKNPWLGEALQKASRRGDTGLVKRLLKNVGLTNDVDVRPSGSYHNARRNKRGRVVNGMRRVILRGNALKQFIREKMLHVGKAKAGWRAAAEKLGVKLPQWILRHPTPGFIRIEEGTLSPSITVGNQVDYQGGFAEAKVIGAAMEQTIRTMKIQAEAIMKQKIKQADR